jgi:hypothetical protein
MDQEGSFKFLGFIDGFSIVIWAIILIYLISSAAIKHKDKSYFKFYKSGFYIKIFSAVFFSIIYIKLYSGGDSTAYWDSAQKLNNLFWENPQKYFHEMFTSDPERMRFNSFDFKTGLPPDWIYKEDEAWFAAKIYSILSFITFRSYFAMTMITAFISFRVSWLLFEFILKYNVISERNAAIATLFLPSTCFWCTGITKDMLIYSAVIYLLLQLFTFINKNHLKEQRNWILLILSLFLIINIRDFMLIATLGPFFMAVGARISKRQKSSFSKIFVQLIFVIFVLIAMFSFLGSNKGKEFAKEAEVIQSDLKTNTTYGDNKYDLGISDFSTIGMLRALPISIFTAFYRPFMWDGGSLFIRLSAIEAFIFLILTLRFVFSSSFFIKLKEIRNNELLMASIIFSLVLGFFAGYTSGLFGVLVRFKAPLLPFLFLVLMYKKENESPKLN